MNLDDLLTQAKLPEHSVEICLRADLVAEYDDLERQFDEAKRHADAVMSLSGTGPMQRIAEQMDALRERMREATLVFRMRGMTRRRWDAFIDEHPAREGNEDDKVADLNRDTYWPALIKESTLEPELTDEQWTRLLDEVLTKAQFEQLARAAMNCNISDAVIPFSPAASRILQSSDAESRRPNDSASASNGSTAGSPSGPSATSTTTPDDSPAP